MMYNNHAGRRNCVYFIPVEAIISAEENVSRIFHGGIIIMEITDVKIRKLMPDGRLRAIVSITLDNAIAVHDIKIIQGDERLFAAMPSRRDESGTFRDIVHPITAEARRNLENAVLDAYMKQLSDSEE